MCATQSSPVAARMSARSASTNVDLPAPGLPATPRIARDESDASAIASRVSRPRIAIRRILRAFQIAGLGDGAFRAPAASLGDGALRAPAASLGDGALRAPAAS